MGSIRFGEGRTHMDPLQGLGGRGGALARKEVADDGREVKEILARGERQDNALL